LPPNNPPATAVYVQPSRGERSHHLDPRHHPARRDPPRDAANTLIAVFHHFLRSAALALAASLCAQSPLTTTFANNNFGNVGNCVYFDVTVATPILITGTALNFQSAAGTTGSVEIYTTPMSRVGKQTVPQSWTLVGVVTCTSNGPGVPTPLNIAPTAVAQGSFGVAYRAIGLAHAYTNGTGSNQIYATAELRLVAGEASNAPFAGPTLAPRVVNVTYSYVTTSPPDDECATASYALQSGLNGPFTNAGYTTSSPTMCASGGSDRWFLLPLQATGAPITIDTCDAAATAPLDTVLEIFDACGGVSLGCNDDTCGLGSSLTFQLPNVPGTTWLRLRVGGFAGNQGNFFVRVRDGGLQPGFTATPTSGPAPLSVQFTDTSTPAGLATQWLWDLDGDGLVDSTVQNPSFVYQQPGNYSVTLVARAGAAAPRTTTRQNFVSVTATLVADFNGAPNSGIAPLQVNFTDTSTATGLPITSWAWDFDGDTVVDSTVQNPSFTYNAPGTYTVSLTVGNGSTTHTRTRTNYIAVAPPLTAGFTSNRRSGVAPLVVQFTDTSTPSSTSITSWAWDFDGDAVVDSTAQNPPPFTYATPGTYTVSLTVGDGVTTHTLTQPNYITASLFLLQADFTPSTVLRSVAPLVVQFADASTASGSAIVSWAWDTDGNGTDDRFGQGPHSITYTTPGTYTVRLTVTNALGAVSAQSRPGLVRVDPTPGDDCGTATILSPGQYEFGPFTTAGCTPSPTAAVCGTTTDRDRWFRFQGLNPYLHRITITHPTGPLHAELRTGSCGSQSAGTCAQSNGNGNEVEILANLTGGQTCYLRVAGQGGSTVSFGIRIRPADDECIGAIPLQVGNNPTSHGSDYSLSPLPLCNGTRDRWFVFTPPYAAVWTIAASSSNAIELRESCGGSLLQPCALSQVSAVLQAQTSYLVRLGFGAGGPTNPTVVVTSGVQVAPRDVVFNELVYDAPNNNQEFVEICNRTGSPIDLAGWQIARVTSNGSHVAIASIPQTTTILPATVSNGTVHQPGLFVFGSGAGAGAPLSGPLPTGATSLRLLNATGELVDTISYGAAFGAVPPQALQGEPLFGHHVYNPLPGRQTSWSRDDDAYVTEGSQGPRSDNGREWRIVAATRGLPNRLSDLRDGVFQDYEGLPAGNVPDWSGGDGPPVFTNDASSPAQPQVAHFAAPASGGGRSFAYQTMAADNFSFEAWVRFELPTLSPGQRCSWSIGACGTTDSQYAAPDPGRGLGVDDNGDTGIAWTYVVHNPGTGTEGWLHLVDNEAGGRDHVVLWRRQITTPGWENLMLAVSPESVEARISGSFDDYVNVPHYGSYGGVYVGVRQSHAGGFGVGVDGVTVQTAWGNRDSVGPGCDGNCPPRNAIPATLSRAYEPADRSYALLVEHVGEPFAAFDVRFYMGVWGQGGAASASVAIYDVVGSGATATVGSQLLVGPHTLEPTQLGWWKAYIGTYQGTIEVPWTYNSSVYVVLTLSRFVQPPIVEKLTDGSPLQNVSYREGSVVNGNWVGGSPRLAPWIVSWRCVNGSQGLDTNAIPTTTDTPGIDFTFSGYSPSALLTAVVLGIAPQVLPLDAIGAPTCKVFVAPLSFLVVGVPPGPMSTVNVPLPNPAALLGIDIHAQWGVLDPAIPNPANLHTSSRRTVTIH
jgi:PKD repeat protein